MGGSRKSAHSLSSSSAAASGRSYRQDHEGQDGHDVAFTGVFGFGIDPQRGDKYAKDDPERIKSWTESCDRLKLNCLVLSDIYSDDFANEYDSNHHVSFMRMTPVLENGTYADEDLTGLTTSDMRFIQLLEYLQSPEGSKVEYALLTDASDVSFYKDPLNLMRTMDTAMDTHYLFGQDEWRPRVSMSGNPGGNDTAVNRGEGYWHTCFGTEMPKDYQADKFYNCGIVGGHRTVLVPFLQRMRYWYTKVPVDVRFQMCDMFVFARTVIEDYDDHIITGYPFHSKFKNTDKGSVAAIYHKSEMPPL